VQLDSANFDYAYHHGYCSYRLGKYEEAIEALSACSGDSAGKIDHDAVCYMLGKAYLKAGNSNEARKLFRAITEDHESSEYAFDAQQSLEELAAGRKLSLRGYTGTAFNDNVNDWQEEADSVETADWGVLADVNLGYCPVNTATTQLDLAVGANQVWYTQVDSSNRQSLYGEISLSQRFSERIRSRITGGVDNYRYGNEHYLLQGNGGGILYAVLSPDLYLSASAEGGIKRHAEPYAYLDGGYVSAAVSANAAVAGGRVTIMPRVRYTYSDARDYEGTVAFQTYCDDTADVYYTNASFSRVSPEPIWHPLVEEFRSYTYDQVAPGLRVRWDIIPSLSLNIRYGFYYRRHRAPHHWNDDPTQYYYVFRDSTYNDYANTEVGEPDARSVVRVDARHTGTLALSWKFTPVVGCELAYSRSLKRVNLSEFNAFAYDYLRNEVVLKLSFKI
jgi:hypothetical protein